MKKVVICLSILALFATAALAADPGDVVMSQVYGGGGNTNAPYQRDYVELFNRTSHAIDISGWSLQYGSASGTTGLGGCTNCIAVLPAGSTIQPCSYFLVALAAGTITTMPALPTPDASGPSNLSGTNGKIGLVADSAILNSCSSPFLMDLLGYGSGNCYETTACGVLSNTTAAIRKVSGTGGMQDTDNNSADFTVGAPAPHNSASGQLAACVGDPVANQFETWGAVKGLYR